MTGRASRRITYVWAVLCTVTVASWWLGHHSRGDAPTAPSAVVTIGVLAMGLVKVRLILRSFMEVATSPAWLRRFTDGWLVVLWGGVLAIYLL